MREAFSYSKIKENVKELKMFQLFLGCTGLDSNEFTVSFQF